MDIPLPNDPKTTLAYIIILDQFSRNMNRIIPIDISYCTELAYNLSNHWIHHKFYQNQPTHYTVFALMPLRHCNKIKDYLLILDILKEINDCDNQVYIRFLFHTQKKLEKLKF